jgi:hypothetical protein
LKKLIIKSLFGTATSITGTVVLKKFGLTLFAVVGDFGPILTVVFSYFLLKDKIKGEDKLLFVIIVSGLAVKFSHPETAKHHDVHADASVLDYIFLGYIPLGIAASNILLRKMKGLHFVQLNIYKIMIALVIAVSICFIT